MSVFVARYEMIKYSAPWYVVRITYDKNGQEMTPDIWEGGSVLLEPGKTYTIEILSVGNAEIEYDFSIHQDNWVYAPDGGVWKCEGALGTDKEAFLKYANVDDILYLTPNLLYKAATGISIDNPEIKDKPMFGETDSKINDVAKVLEDNWLANTNSELSGFLTYGGAGLTVGSALVAYMGIELTPVLNYVVIGAGVVAAIGSVLIQGETDSVTRMKEDVTEQMKQGEMYVSITGVNSGLIDMEPWNEYGYVYKVKTMSFYGDVSQIDSENTKDYLGL